MSYASGVTEMGSRTVLLVEDHPLMRALIAESLESAGFVVSAHADATSALDALDDVDPDALVTDLDLGSRPDGAEAALIARQRAPYLAVVYLSNYPRAASAPHSVKALTDAHFVNKASLTSGAELARVVDVALRASPRRLGGTIAETDGEGELMQLTRTQLEVLALIARGHSNAEIARRSGRGLRAVERTITRIFDTLGVGSDPTVNPRVASSNRYISAFGTPVDDAAP